MGRKQPDGPPPPPPVQRVRIRYAKRGRLRFSSHRDFARAFERALRRAEIPMAYSAGFNPHPRISYVGAAPTGVGSEAEYLEIALCRHCEPADLRERLDDVLPDGLDIVAAVDAADCEPGNFAEQMQASLWLLELDADLDALRAAVGALLAADTAIVQRLTKDGHRDIDARAPLVSATARAWTPPFEAFVLPKASATHALSTQRAILDIVVRQATPSVRPDDVLAALHSVAGFAPARPARATRVAQGPLEESGVVRDPFGDVRPAPRELASARPPASAS